MSKLYKYQKVTDQYTTYTLLTIDNDEERAVELGTIDGITYVSVPENIILPSQPKQISESVVYVGDGYDEQKLISNFNITRNQSIENKNILIATALNNDLNAYICSYYDMGTQQTFQAIYANPGTSETVKTNLSSLFSWILDECLVYYYTKRTEILASDEPELIVWDFSQFDNTKPDITLFGLVTSGVSSKIVDV